MRSYKPATILAIAAALALSGCSQNQAVEDQEAPTPTAGESVNPEDPAEEETAEPVEELPAEPTTLEEFLGDPGIDTSGWQTVNIDGYEISLPLDWKIFNPGDNPDVDSTYLGFYREELRLVSTPGDPATLERWPDRGAQPTLIVQAKTLSEEDLARFEEAGVEPHLHKFGYLSGSMRDTVQFPKSGLESHVSYASKLGAPSAADGFMVQSAIAFHGVNRDGLEVWIVDEGSDTSLSNAILLSVVEAN